MVLLGFDGSGKSTLLARLRADGIATSSWRDLQELPEMNFFRPVTLDPGRYRSALPPLTRAAYLLIALCAEYEILIEPRLNAGLLVVVESYYLRPLAKELVKAKAETGFLRTATAYMREPSDVVVLEVPPEVAFARKGMLLTANDVAQTDQAPTLEAFASFQKEVLACALMLAGGARIHVIDATVTADEAYRALKNITNSA